MTMRARLATSSMMDTMSFARELESIYRRLVELEADPAVLKNGDR